MVKTMKTSLFVSFAAILMLTACDPEPKTPVAVDNSNGITLKFVGQIGQSDISKVSSMTHFFKSEGERFSVSNWAMILSHVALIKNNGDTLQLGDGYQYVNYMDNTKNQRLVKNIPTGRYKGITFMLGLDQAINHGDPTIWPANHPLNGFTTGLHWGWSGGYIFHAFDGNYIKDSVSSSTNGFSFHTATDRYPQKVTLNFEFDIDNTQKTAYIVSNAEDIFAKPNSVKLANGSVSHSEGTAEIALMDKLVENIVAAFSFGKVE